MKYSNKPLADHDDIVSEELLPYPIVHYPGFYGTFFAFSKDKISPLALCSCFRAALSNYLNIILLHNEDDFIIEKFRRLPEGKAILDKRFPIALIKQFSEIAYTPQEILEQLNFQPMLCHECNNATPVYLYCPGAYGSSFKQNFGWFINKLSLEFGIDHGNVYFPELCPPEILSLVSIPIVIDGKINREYFHWKNGEKARKQRDLIQRTMENIVRPRFGHKKIGDSWTNETILYQIICSLFPSYKILRHYRPKFLKGLELDIYIQEINLALEYQGIQHFQPVEHWGGVGALTLLQERDGIKKRMCGRYKIKLVYFDYTEGLSSMYVAEKIKDYL